MGQAMFGKPSLLRDYAGIIQQLKQGERRAAQHKRPHAVTDKGFESVASMATRAVFEGFEYFGAVLNQNVAEPWTIEETGDTLVKDLELDEPALGRTYRVYYNGVQLGRLQITDKPQGGLFESFEWHQEHRGALVILELDYLRFVPYDHAVSLVSMVELFAGKFGDSDEARFQAQAKAVAALTGYLWEVQRVEDYVPNFQHRTYGPYDLLAITTAHWKEGGIDPFERWNGDRPQQWSDCC